MKQANPLPAGAVAPTFAYRTAAGAAAHTRDLAGQTYLVYFYPKADTPGCTKEACGFRDRFAELKAAGVTVIGVSPDKDKALDKFRTKYELPFALAGDLDHQIVDSFGAFGEKKFMGKTYEGLHRMSFLIGPDGKIAKTYPKVDVEGHAGEVLADARALGLAQG